MLSAEELVLNGIAPEVGSILTPAAPAQKLATPKQPTKEAPIVSLAKEYSDLLGRLHREEKLLVCAEERIVLLKDSITKLKSDAEAARQKLVEFVTN